MSESNDNISDLRMEQLRRSDDNGDTTPEELLKLVLDDMSRGKVGEISSLAILAVEDVDGGGHRLNIYRANMSRVQELGWLEAFKLQSWRNWAGI